MGKIVLGMIPLTVDIADEKRQTLAYNMLYHMMENGAEITVYGKDISSGKEQLYVCNDVDGEEQYTKPNMDPEWIDGQNADTGDKRFTTACMSDDYTLVMFAPTTGSYEKANEMNNFMLTGIDSSVSIFMPSEGKTKPIVIKGHPIHEGMLMNGQLCTERFERNWTQGKASEILYDDKKSHESANDEDMDFADAVANIPVNEQGMEQ